MICLNLIKILIFPEASRLKAGCVSLKHPAVYTQRLMPRPSSYMRIPCLCIYIIFTFRKLLAIDLLAIQQKSLDRALFLYIFIYEIRPSGVRASITIVHIRKFYKM